MGSNFRPSPLRTDHSPGRGSRFSGRDYRDNRPHERRDSRNEDKEAYQERSRSRSPYARRDSDRYSRSSFDRLERYTGSGERSSSWNNYRPYYSAPDKVSSIRSPNSAQNSRSASPFHAPDVPLQSEASKQHQMSSSTPKEAPRHPSKSTIASGGTKVDSSPDPLKRDQVVSRVDQSRDVNKQIPEPNLAGVHISPTSPPIPPREALPQTILPVMPPVEQATILLENSPSAATEFGLRFKHLAEAAAEVYTTKAQLEAAVRRFEKRNSEFEKSKPHHEKFPDIKESHGMNIKDAEKAVRSLEVKLKQQDTSFEELALRTTNQLIPDVIAQAQRGKGVNEEQLDEVTKTCAGLKDLIERQRDTFFSELQKDRHEHQKEIERVEKLHKEAENLLKAEIQYLRNQVCTAIPQEHQKLQVTVDQLSKDTSEAKKGSVELMSQVTQLSTKAKEQSIDIKTLSNRTGGLSEIEKQLKNVSDGLLSADTRVTDLSKNYEMWSSKLTHLKPDISSIESRVQKVEELIPNLTLDAAIKKELDDLKNQLKIATETTSPKPTVEILNAQLLAEARIQALECDFTQKVDLLKANGIFELKNMEVQAAVTSSNENQNRTREIEERIGSSTRGAQQMTIEQRLYNLEESKNLSVHPDSKAEGSLRAVDENAIQAVKVMQGKLTEVANDVEIVKAIQETLQESIGITVNAGIATVTAECDAKQLSIQNQVEIFGSRLETVETTQDTLDQEMKSTAKSLSAILDPATGLEKNVAKFINRTSETFNQESAKTANAIQGLSHVINDLRSRLDNINSRELAQSMLGQLGEVFPNLMNHETTFQNIRSALSAFDGRLRKVAAQQAPDNQDAESKAIRNDIATLTTKIDEIEAAVKHANQTSTSTTSSMTTFRDELRNQHESDSNALTEVIVENDGKIDALIERVTGQDGRIDALAERATRHEEQIQALKREPSRALALPQVPWKKQAPSGPSTSLPPQVSSKVAAPMRNSSNRLSPPVSKSARQSSVSSSKQAAQGSFVSESDYRPQNHQPRQGSTAYETIRKVSVATAATESGNKLKRKHRAKGFVSSNSLKNSKSSTPERKKTRWENPIPDSDDDPNYDPEDDIPQPQMGSDDDELV